ncbi:unnamed protein product [Clavelina lepadiformis]|uniref:G-protein coupled receptors family 3 profile domain-containing protein n=1 Tax=Clavelina lepadiformis TaxID=159417 RepID=A0ABP0GQT6_CLALP
MVLLVWSLFNPPNASVYYPSLKESLLACNDVEDLIVLIGLAYPFLLILSCTILATINRKVPTGFNETQYIGSYKASTMSNVAPRSVTSQTTKGDKEISHNDLEMSIKEIKETALVV